MGIKINMKKRFGDKISNHVTDVVRNTYALHMLNTLMSIIHGTNESVYKVLKDLKTQFISNQKNGKNNEVLRRKINFIFQESLKDHLKKEKMPRQERKILKRELKKSSNCYIMSYCNNCKKYFTTVKYCSVCKKKAYCSKECQIKHWNKGHKKKCTK